MRIAVLDFIYGSFKFNKKFKSHIVHASYFNSLLSLKRFLCCLCRQHDYYVLFN